MSKFGKAIFVFGLMLAAVGAVWRSEYSFAFEISGILSVATGIFA